MAEEAEVELEPIDTGDTGDSGDAGLPDASSASAAPAVEPSGDTGDGDDGKPKPLRDSIRAAWDKHKKELQAIEGDQPKPAKPPKAAAPIKPIPAKAGDAQTSAGARAAPSVATTANPPNGWPAEAKQAWGALPDVVKSAVAKLEQSTQHGLQQLKARHDAYDREAAKLDSMFQRSGVDRATGMKNLVAWAHALNANPAQFLQQLAQAIGYQLPAAQANGHAGQQPRQQFDLRAAVQPLLSPLQQELNQLKQARANEAQAASDAMVNSWAKDKPHFDAVRHVMKDILDVAIKNGGANQYLDANGAPDLTKLYETAVYMNPETRQAVLAEQARARQTQQRQQAQNAKRAGASLRPSPPSARTPLEKPTLRDTIRESMDAVMNR